MNKQYPLGLPRGSVRALITLALLGISGFFHYQGIDAQLFDGFLGATIAFYFNKRSQEDANELRSNQNAG